jgi:hypothetical protein
VYSIYRISFLTEKGELNMKKKVLIITSSYNYHADFLCPKIEKQGIEAFRFDTDKLNRYEIDFRISSDTFFSIRNRCGRKTISKEDIGTIWYRRPSPDKSSDKFMDDDGIRFLRNESKEWIKSITFALKDSFWVVAPWILHESRIKANQLIAAQSFGLNVPRTIITRNRELIRDFFHNSPNGIIAKTLKTQYIESKHYGFTLSTQEINEGDLRDKNLYISPSIFQEKIEAAYELRIVAIGRRLFAFKVRTKKRKKFLDIRVHGLENIEYTPTEISKDLSQKIFGILNHFHLPFSSMDLLVDNTGKKYFIDLNPNGQWLWLELQTGVIISDLFTEMLINQKMPR